MHSFQQSDLDHLLGTIDRAIEQLQDAKKLLNESNRGALHSIVRAAEASTYARRLATKMAKTVMPTR